MTRTGEPSIGEARRGAIMAAATKVCARNGFDSTSIADVAGEAGLPFDVVYQLFDSKDALQDKGFNKRLTDIYERLIHDIETLIAAAQARREVLAVPPRLVAYRLTALIGQ